MKRAQVVAAARPTVNVQAGQQPAVILMLFFCSKLKTNDRLLIFE